MALAGWPAFSAVCVQALCHEAMHRCTPPRAARAQTPRLPCRLLLMQPRSSFPDTTAGIKSTASPSVPWTTCFVLQRKSGGHGFPRWLMSSPYNWRLRGSLAGALMLL
jgi:hypothetical protein